MPDPTRDVPPASPRLKRVFHREGRAHRPHHPGRGPRRLQALKQDGPPSDGAVVQQVEQRRDVGLRAMRVMEPAPLHEEMGERPPLEPERAPVDVAHGAVVRLRARGGAFRKEDALGLFVDSVRDRLFAAIDAGSGRLELYAPKTIDVTAFADSTARTPTIRPLDGTRSPEYQNADPEKRFDGLSELPMNLRPA